MADEELIPTERCELHRVLEEARAGSEPGPGDRREPRVVVPAALKDAVEVESVALGDHVKLVDGGELNVPPRIRQEFCEFRLHRLHDDQVVGHGAKELLYFMHSTVVERAHHLW